MAGGSVNGMLLNAAQDYLNRRAHRGIAAAQDATENRKIDIMEGQGDEQRQSMLDRIKLQADHALALQAMKNQGSLEKQAEYNRGANDVATLNTTQRHLDELAKQQSAFERQQQDIASKERIQQMRMGAAQALRQLQDETQMALADKNNQSAERRAVITGEYKVRSSQIYAGAAQAGLDGKVLDALAADMRLQDQLANANDEKNRFTPGYKPQGPASRQGPARDAVKDKITEINNKKPLGGGSMGVKTTQPSPNPGLLNNYFPQKSMKQDDPGY